MKQSPSPLKIPVTLAPNPKQPPKYHIIIKDKKHKDIILGDPKATRALIALMNQAAVNGGAASHWGGPSAFAEIMSALHGKMFQAQDWRESFNFVNDAGHTENGIYALRANYNFDNLTINDLLKFRSIESKLTGHGESHLNPEGVYISNGPLGSGLPQAQGLAFADKLSQKNRTTICTLSDGAAMEGEAKESFSAIPGLAQKGKLSPFLLILSDNNTKLSGRITDDSFSMEPTFKSLENLGWKVIQVSNGHNLQSVYSHIEDSLNLVQKKPNTPIALWIKTIKGYGVKATEEQNSGGHGFPLKPHSDQLIDFLNEIYDNQLPNEFKEIALQLQQKPQSQETLSLIKKEKVQPGFSRAAIQAVKEGLPVFSVSSDLQGSTGIATFQKAYPQHFIDIGIAESNMISTGTGLSKQGFIPIVDTFSQFGVTKGNLPLIMSALSQAPVIALFSHCGYQDAADGASHQSTTYLSAVSSIPHTTVIQVSCSSEAEAYMYQALKIFQEKKLKGETPDNIIFFFGRENHPVSYKEGIDYVWGKAQVLQQGNHVTLVSSGPMVQKALKAQAFMQEKGINATVINNCFINKPDIQTIATELKKSSGKLITIEDHQLIGGMGSQLVHALALSGEKFNVKSLASHGSFGQSAYTADQLYKKHNLTEEDIFQAYTEL